MELSYKVNLPETGCNVFYGAYIDNYNNGTRTRYYLNYDTLVASTTSSYTRVPDGAVCLSQGDLSYKPETEVYFRFLVITSALIIFWLAYRFILHPFWRRHV